MTETTYKFINSLSFWVFLRISYYFFRFLVMCRKVLFKICLNSELFASSRRQSLILERILKVVYIIVIYYSVNPLCCPIVDKFCSPLPINCY